MQEQDVWQGEPDYMAMHDEMQQEYSPVESGDVPQQEVDNAFPEAFPEANVGAGLDVGAATIDNSTPESFAPAVAPVGFGDFEEEGELAKLRVPPHSIEAERSVLGGLLMDNEIWDRISDAVYEVDFYRYEHRVIFECVKALLSAGKPADVVTVFERLQVLGKSQEVGGLEYLNGLAQYVPSIGNVKRYAEIVRERAILRRLISSSDEIAASAFHTEGKSVSTLLDEAEQKILRIGEESARMKQGALSLKADLVGDFIDRIESLSENPGDVTGVPTGFYDLDKRTSGLQKGDLVILAARPSMGKTALAINIAEHAAIEEGLPVLVFSMEMSAQQLTTRIFGSLGRINQNHLRTGQLTDDEWPRLVEVCEKINNSAVSLHIDESVGLGIGEIRASSRRLARSHGSLGLIVIDYLQLINVHSNENRATALGEVSRGLKMLAKELECPVLVLSQLNRSVESRPDKRPMMSDLRESGAIEQDADVIMFIYRDEYYTKEECQEPGVAEIIIAKQRNGPTGTVKLTFMKECTKFESMAVPMYEDYE